MTYNRRSFLKVSAALGAGMALQSLPGCGTLGGGGKEVRKFGLQLYTLRSEMPKDPRGVLKQVSDFGYKQIESYEGREGFLWGMTPKDFGSYMDDLDMKIVASHVNINQDFQRKVDQASELKMKYLICPYLGAQKSLDDYKKAADKFNECGEMCRKGGLRFAYHNHDYSFIQMKSEFPQDVMMKNTDPALVDYEMDIYWVVTAGQDPVTWFQRHPNRFRLSHMKDRKRNVETTEKDASTVLGQGSINWPEIMKQAREKGMEYFIVEQERYDNTTPLAAAKANAEYMKAFRFS